MQEEKSTSKLTQAEMETYFSICYPDSDWIADTSIPKDMRKLQKQGWEVIGTQYYPDGTVQAMRFKARRNALSICKAERPVRTITEEQRQILSERMKNNLKNKHT